MPGGAGAREAGYGKKGKRESGERQRAKLARRGTLFGTGRPAAHATRPECHRQSASVRVSEIGAYAASVCGVIV